MKLFRESLGYDYLGDWTDRPDNRNIEEGYLRPFLKKQGYSETLINRALYELKRVAGDQTKSLYDINKAVYGLLRYGVQGQTRCGREHPNRLADRLEEPADQPLCHGRRGHRQRQARQAPDVVLYVNGIALGVLELKRSVVSVARASVRTWTTRRPIFIEPLFHHDATGHGGQRHRRLALWRSSAPLKSIT